MTASTYTVVTASLRSFVAREFTGLTWKQAQELVASEKADGWFAWIAENECEVIEDGIGFVRALRGRTGR